jgi:hypothetical protein
MAIETPAAATVNDRAGILLMQNLNDGSSCGLSYDGTGFVLTYGGTISPFAAGKPPVVTPGTVVVIRLSANGTKNWTCELVGGEKIVAQTASPGLRVRLYATTSMKARYIDVSR